MSRYLERRSWRPAGVAAMTALSVATLGAVPLVASSADVGASPAPIALTGVVAGVDHLQPTSVVIQIEPDAETLAQYPEAVSVLPSQVPVSAITTHENRYTVRLDPSELPPEVVADDGMVTFNVFVQDPVDARYAYSSASVRAVLNSSGELSWTDPLNGVEDVSGVGTGTSASPAARRAIAHLDEGEHGITSKFSRATRPVRLRMSAPGNLGTLCAAEECAPTRQKNARTVPLSIPSADGDDDGTLVEAPEFIEGVEAENCDGAKNEWGEYYTNKYRRVSATIGTSYPVGDDTAWMEHSAGSSDDFTTALGVGFSADPPHASGSFSQSGTKARSRGVGFNWDPKGYKRSYRIEVKYRQVQGLYDLCPGDTPYWVRWDPVGMTGGFGENTENVSRPDWDHCVSITSTGTWVRQSANGSAYTYAAGVKFAGVIGVDLSAARAYNQEAKLIYRLKVKNRRMCGSNRDPAYAAKVMERL